MGKSSEVPWVAAEQAKTVAEYSAAHNEQENLDSSQTSKPESNVNCMYQLNIIRTKV